LKNRIGQGVDVHQLVAGTPLIIGGVSIPYPKGSKGHSDGDVLYHAIVDAILGALAMGDIGQHFPSDDERWKDIQSREFLEHAQYLMQEKGYATVNIDATVILQKPGLSSYIPEMRRNIARVLSISIDSVSVKATTTDHLGFIGTEDGIAATAIVLLTEPDGN
jgi:2-C-methyl-D-erythritol 2,4-cyclodiphosphate synthase